MNNKSLAQIFNDMSAIYQYLGREQRFRALAYKKAAKVVSGLQEDVEVFYKNGTLEKLPGIGESIAEKIVEYLNTGSIKKYESLKGKVPYKLLELAEIKGFGYQSLKKIHSNLKIDSKEEVVAALQDGRILNLKGFGLKKVEDMLRGLKLHKTIEDRMLLWDALNEGEKVLEWVRKIPEVKQAELAGSLRRRKETIGDIDLLVSCEEKQRTKVIQQLATYPSIRRLLAKGVTKVSVVLKKSEMQIDFRIVNEEEWGAALQYFTGSKEHNIHLRTIAREKGYKISEYGLFEQKGNKYVAGKKEEEIYSTLGLQWMPPEMREDSGEIELAQHHNVPQLIGINDIKGDLQMHSVWSDGLNSIEEIAQFVKKNYKYEYIVITDHSKSSRIANGMDEKEILKQLKEIDKVNAALGEDFIKKGIEVDILPNGKLDISDEVLSQLSWVTASIHTGFKSDNTDRIARACENIFVSCIGHPTGRLIGKREAYTIDLEKIVAVAKETGTALEINAQPDRMDLNEAHIKYAREKGVKMVISTDAHALANYDFMKLGIFVARRGWCKADDILNTQSWKEIQKFAQQKRKLMKTLA